MEIWKDIEGYEGLYQVSNLGRVKSLERKIKDSIGRIQLHNSKLLTPINNGKGYLVVGLSKNSIIKRYLIHKLVAEVFITNPDNYPIINHIDGDKTNNKMNNLEWCTQKYNIQHASTNGLLNSVKGESHPKTKFKEKDILYIRSSKLSQIELAKKYGVCKTTISGIIRRRTWSHI